MASNSLPAGGREYSFQHDPRMRQALARLGRKDRALSSNGPAGTSLYWLLRSRRPNLAALSGRLSQADLLVVACALADCGGKLVADPADHGTTHAALAAAGLDWTLRNGDCLPCLCRVRPYDCLIIGESHVGLDGWRNHLARNALLLGLSRTPAMVAKLAERMLTERLAREIARLRDGRRCLLIADHDPG